MRVYEIIEDIDGNIFSSIWETREQAEEEFRRIFTSVWKDCEAEGEPMDDFFHDVDDCIDEGLAVFGDRRIFFRQKAVSRKQKSSCQ